MPRYIRNTALLAKIETTEGVDSVPTGALTVVGAGVSSDAAKCAR